MLNIKDLNISVNSTLKSRFIKVIPESVLDKLLFFRGLKNPIMLKKSIRELNNLFSGVGTSQMNFYLDWKTALSKYILAFPQNIDLVSSFVQCDLKPVKINTNTNKKSVTLICVVKNDLERIKMLYEHHRSIGIKHFVIVDNDSDDGTKEWLIKQSDTDVFSVEEKFTSLKKYGWINRIISIYGFNKWYLYVDSDELFVYNDCEKKDINSLTKYCETNKITRLSSMMVDMYSRDGIFKTDMSTESIKEEYRYFDSDTYFKFNNYKGIVMRGGPRKRVMTDNSNWPGPVLTKHPLFYFKKGDIFESAHYIYPFIKKDYIESALLHYKFLETDLIRYEKIAKDGNFSRGSLEYKEYIKTYEKNNNLTFMYDASVLYENSQSINHIKAIQPIKWTD